MTDPRAEFERLRERIARALWNFAFAADDFVEPEPFPEDGSERDDALASADAVLAVLDLRVCCVVCGLDPEDCTAWDHGEYAHDYAPLVFVGAAQSGRDEP